MHFFIKNTAKAVILWYYNLKSVLYVNIFLDVFYSCDGKAEYLAALTLVFCVTCLSIDRHQKKVVLFN